ncbi:MAG: DUF2281 domain-containing protein [Rivularia sp. (in: cyanobacteria)]|jgi:hypothetical protein
MTYQAINNASELISKLQNLPIEQQQQVLDFIDFLTQKYISTSDKFEKKPKQRILGLYENQIWISDDFNEPLSDEFWLGEGEI